MKGTKRLAVLAMFTAIALTIFVAEAQIPPVVPIPGVKLGLANIVTLIAMALLGRRQAGEILLVRIVLGSVFTGGVSAMLFSIAGGVFAYLVMCLTIRRLPERLLWVVSVLAAFGHNAGQLLVAVWVTGTPSILVYAPALVAASVITGAFTGVAAMYLVRALRKTGTFRRHEPVLSFFHNILTPRVFKMLCKLEAAVFGNCGFVVQMRQNTQKKYSNIHQKRT